MYWDVLLVRPLPEFQIYVELRNGVKGRFDLRPYLQHGQFSELNDHAYFCKVGIDGGAVSWPHGQDIAPDTLLAQLVPLEQQTPPQRLGKSR